MNSSRESFILKLFTGMHTFLPSKVVTTFESDFLSHLLGSGSSVGIGPGINDFSPCSAPNLQSWFWF